MSALVLTFLFFAPMAIALPGSSGLADREGNRGQLRKGDGSRMRPFRSLAFVAGAALFVPLGVSCKGGSTEPTPPSGLTASAPANVQQATFHVESMTCGSWNVAVKVAAERVDGVTEARASHAEKRAWVSFDPARTSPEAIARAITKAGYGATQEAASATN